MKLKTSDHYEIDYELFGDETNTPVVLIHGLGADKNMWRPQIQSYVQKKLFLIVPDMRGHGNSSKVPSFRIEDCAKDISEILEHHQIDKAVIMGVSMGGVIAQQFALDYPDKTDKLIISDSFSEVSTFLEKLGAWGQWLTIKVAPGLLIRSLKTVYKGTEMVDVLKYFQDTYAKTDKKQLAKARAALNRFDIKDQLGEVNIHSLVMLGDGFGDFAINMARKTAENIDDAEFKILKGGIDPSNMVVSELFDGQVLAFLEK